MASTHGYLVAYTYLPLYFKIISKTAKEECLQHPFTTLLWNYKC